MPRFGLPGAARREGEWSSSIGSSDDSDSGGEEEPPHPIGFGSPLPGGSSSPWGTTWFSLDPPPRGAASGRSSYGWDDSEGLPVQSYPPLSAYLPSNRMPTIALLRWGKDRGPFRSGGDDDLCYSGDEDDDEDDARDCGARGRAARPAPREAWAAPPDTEREISGRVEAVRRRVDEECRRAEELLGELVARSHREADAILERRRAEEERLRKAREAEDDRLRAVREAAAERDRAEQERAAAVLERETEKEQAATRDREARAAETERRRREREAAAKKATEYIDKAKKLVGQLVQVRASVEPFEKNKTVGKRRLGMKKMANGKVNTLNDNPSKIREVATQISTAIAAYEQEDGQIKTQLQQGAPGLTSDMAVGRRYFVDLLASTAMKRVQAESFGGTKGDGFPLAAMLAMVSVESKQIISVLAAHIYTVCPVAIPTLPAPRDNASEDDLMIGLGMQRNQKTGEFETFPRFLARTENIVSFVAALQSSLPSSHQLMGGHAGAMLWLKRFIDLLPLPPTSPLPLTTAPVLGAFLTVAGHMMANAHADDFRTMLATIQNDVMNRLDEGELGKPSAIRLGKVVEGGFDSFRKNLPPKAVPELYYGASEHSHKKEGVVSFGGTIGGEEDVQPKKPQGMQQQPPPQNPFGGGVSFGGPSSTGGGNPNTFSGGGGAAASSSPFGGGGMAASPSPFGGGAAPSPSPFGGGNAGANQSPFGSGSAAGLSPSPFGGGGGGGMAPSPSPFGGGMAPSPSPFGGGGMAPSPSPFAGGTAPSPSPFGGGAGPSPSPFGRGNTNANPSPFGGGGMAPSPSPFGSGGMAPSPSPFGSSNRAPSPSPFGGNTSSSPFGRGNQMQQNSPFGGRNAKKKGPCRFFAQGKCKKGDNCEYSHESGGGNSGFGGGFQQNNHGSSGQGFQQNYNNNNKVGKKGPCRFFAMGKCKKGKNCPYLHETGGDSGNNGFGGGNQGFQSNNNWNSFGRRRR
ncbi:unnamed protein product [Pseudo-nitzschia multistriata]|uniref:mRNA export factor GLE1 n=1 Tax=Pseudo-nitzschia multistriata TaxID=183589 RepID=A0A448ZF59_9STRA|nr:unnamed protein product [Pseudo-nitzschia multistriata]